MSLQRADVEKVALLARLELTPDELDVMTGQLAQIVAYVEQLQSLDTRNVAPLSHVAELINVFAADDPSRSLAREAALANAPQHDGEYFLVPPVLGE